MALTELTKVTGPGIHTLSNILSHNIKSSGIITATKFSGPLDSIGGNFAGVITATNGVFSGNISAVDGNFSGNVTIGGTLTYEDVTNIDSVGIITAQKDIHVGAGVSAVGVGTFSGLDISGDIDVDGHTNLDNVSIAGVTTGTIFKVPDATNVSGATNHIAIGDNSDLKLYHDNNGDAYVSNATGHLTIRNNTSGKIINLQPKSGANGIIARYEGAAELYYNNEKKLQTQSDGVEINGSNGLQIYGETGSNTNALLNLYPTGSAVYSTIKLNNAAGNVFCSLSTLNGGTLYISSANGGNIVYRGTGTGDHVFETNSVERMRINDGVITFASNIDLNADLDVDGHTNLDNVSIVGVTTVTGEIKIPDLSGSSNKISLGTNQNLQIYYDASSYITNSTAGHLIIKTINGGSDINLESADDFFVKTGGTLNSIICRDSAQVELYHNNIKTAFTDVDQWKVYGRTSNSGMVEIASNQGANNNDRFRIHKTSAASRLTIQAYSTGSWVENIRITAGGAVELKHADGTTKFQTGSTVNTNSNHFEITSGQQLRFDNSNDNRSSEILNTGSSGNSTLAFKTNGGTRWTIDSSGHIIPGAVGSYDIGSTSAEIGNVYIADDKQLTLGNDSNLYIKHSNGHANNFVVSSVGDIEHHMALSKKIIKGFNNSGTPYVNLYQGDNNIRLTTTSTGITVTGEVAASQDYPNFRPTLDLNFAAQKKLDPRITYQRTGTASFTDEFGKVVLVGDNAPRFDHDPVTRESKGLLIEESRTNYAVYSTKVNNANGNYNMINGAVLVSDAGEAPDGTNTATKMYPNSSGGGRGIEYTWTAPSTGNYTTSIYVKAAGHTGWIALYGIDGGTRAYFNPTTGAAGQPGTYSSTPAAGDYGIEDAGNGWYRIHLTDTQSNISAADYFYLYFSDSDGSVNVTHSGQNGILMWGLQIEKGDFPTSYIPTSSAAVTRGYEAVTLEGTDFSDVFGTEFKEFSLVADYDNTQTDDGTNYGIIDLWGEASGYDDRIEWFKDNSSPYHIETRTFGGGNPLFANGTLSASSKAKSQRFATSWYVPDYSNTSSRRFVVSMGGETVDVVSDSSGTTVPQITRMGIGCNPTRLDLSPGLLHFKRLMVYNKTLSDGQLQNLSAQ